MKKYVVMRVYKSAVSPSILFETDYEDDAKQYATIMSHQDDYLYSVAEITFTIGG